MRSKLAEQMADLFIQYEKVMYAPSGEQAEKAERLATVANEMARSTRRELAKRLQDAP